MEKVRQMLWVSRVEFRKFLNLKILIVMLFSFLFLGEEITGKMLQISAETGLQLGFAEPLLLVMSQSFYAMIVPLTFTVLLSDFPDRDSGSVFIMARIQRRIWLGGQLIFALLAGLFYLCFLFAGNLIWMHKAGIFTLEWSPYMLDTAWKFPEIFSVNGVYFFQSATLTQGTPVRVFLTSIFFMMFYFLTVSQVLCIFKMLRWKRMGLFVNMAVSVFGAVAVSYVDKIKWFFPLAHTIYGLHFREFFAEPEMSLGHSCCYFVVLNAFLLMVNLWLVKKCQIGDAVE